MKRRRRIDPGKAREVAMGNGFYSRIEVTRSGWPSCASCGNKAATVDRESTVNA